MWCLRPRRPGSCSNNRMHRSPRFRCPRGHGPAYPAGYPDAIAEAVLKMIRDPDRRQRMGEAARAWVREHFIEERVLGLTANYYRSLLESAPAPRLQGA